MNTTPMIQRIPAVMLGTALLLASACGGGGGSTDSTAGGTSVASRGIITGFGSVYVNGIKYRTEGTRISIDDDEGNEAELRVGMIVTVRGRLNDDGSASAEQIIYDNELKGPVTAITPDAGDPSRKTLTILGQQVLVTADTTIDDDGGLTFDTINVGDVLEVGGYVTEAGFTATHLELQDNDLNIEIKGHIENLTANSFEIRGLAISYDGSTRLDDITTLSEGLFVEVKGQLDGLGTTLLASKIEAEGEGLDDDLDEAEIRGVISAYDGVDNTFMIQGQAVDASRATLKPASLVLANDLTVEVEGRIENGILIAEEIEQKGRKIKIHAPLAAVDVGGGTIGFSFNGRDITVRVNAGTEIEDDNSSQDLLISDLMPGDFVELEAYGDGADINAVEVKRGSADPIRLVAPLESFDSGVLSVVLLGIDFDLSAASFEDDEDSSLSALEFFDRLVAGTFVTIRDQDSNAVFDKAELDD
jgi:hypothetical protein